MPDYYVNTKKDSHGDNEVHKVGCHRFPSAQNRKRLGNYYTCVPAVAEAKRLGYNANGCIHCSKPCHTG